MTYTLKDYENYLKNLKKVNELSWVKNYLDLKEKPNFWTIIEYGKYESSNGRSAHETRMSKMIRWMMDPNENHGLGNIFAYKLMDLLGETYEYSLEENKEIKTIAEYYSKIKEDSKVKKDNKDRRVYIDVLYKDLSRKMCLAIELKQHAKEGQRENGSSQLDDYELVVGNLTKGKELEPYYIFLTPLKEKPTNKQWHALGYQELIDLINEVYNDYMIHSNHPYVEDVKKIIMDFKDELQRTLDIKKRDKDKIDIIRKFSNKEKGLTKSLAKEIQEDIDSKRMEELIKINKEEDLNIKELILLVNECLNSQDHSINSEVQVLTRKIYNYLSGDKVLDTVQIREYSEKETSTPIKSNLVNSHGIKFVRMQLTHGKGQGVNMYSEDGKHRIYLSGESSGRFPNHGVQLLEVPNKGKMIRSDKLKTGTFKLKDNLILEDKIHDKDGNMVTFDQLMEDYIIPALKELGDKIVDLS